MTAMNSVDALIKASCPTATHDIAVNLTNRKKAIKTAAYGPLNPSEANTEFWQAKADEWNTTIPEAKKQRCGNCAFFIQTSAMKECISNGIAEGDTKADAYLVASAGDLGYCEAFDFKCASRRTCRAWVSGGPITDKNKKVEKADYSTEERQALADQGKALSDGSFPIKNINDLKNGIQSYGRAGNKEDAKAHIIKRAKELKAESLIPESWM